MRRFCQNSVGDSGLKALADGLIVNLGCNLKHLGLVEYLFLLVMIEFYTLSDCFVVPSLMRESSQFAVLL